MLSKHNIRGQSIPFRNFLQSRHNLSREAQRPLDSEYKLTSSLLISSCFLNIWQNQSAAGCDRLNPRSIWRVCDPRGHTFDGLHTSCHRACIFSSAGSIYSEELSHLRTAGYSKGEGDTGTHLGNLLKAIALSGHRACTASVSPPCSPVSARSV